jgi:N-acetylglucosaminyldiphosphoundecaprenol N-acetyl-beta-D-mannosaminyltransferase
VNRVCSARRDARHRAILNRAILTTPDGMPLVWLGQRAGHAETARVYGPDLLLAVATATASTGRRHYFCGAGPGTGDLLAATLRALAWFSLRRDRIPALWRDQP